ncbi:hypothetical protein [Mesorhizobium japonicum]
MTATALATATAMTASAQPQMTTIAKAIRSNPNEAPNDATDPRAYLNEVDDDEAMTWVRAHNLSTVNKLSKDPRYRQYQADILKILQATDRIASPGLAQGDMIDNSGRTGRTCKPCGGVRTGNPTGQASRNGAPSSMSMHCPRPRATCRDTPAVTPSNTPTCLKNSWTIVRKP